MATLVGGIAGRCWWHAANRDGTVDVQLALSTRPLARCCHQRTRRNRSGDSSARRNPRGGVPSYGFEWYAGPAGNPWPRSRQRSKRGSTSSDTISCC